MGSCSSTIRACSAGAAALLVFAAAGCRKVQLPDYGGVPNFILTSQTGAEFHGGELDGSVWVGEFFFTHCTGPCPRMNSRFRQLQNLFSRADMKLVSFTVDPARDSVPVLADYAHRFGAQPGRWFFLTGPMDRLDYLCRHVFLLGNVNGGLDHSTQFVLVDRQRHIRGFYRSGDNDQMHKLMDDIRSLLKERA